MSQGTQLVIKILVVCAIFLPYKFIIMHDRTSGFLQDFLVAAVAYATAYGLIALLNRNKS